MTKQKNNTRHNAFFVQLLEQIEAESAGSTICLAAHVCGKGDDPFFIALLKAGVLTERLADYVDCIACEGKAKVERNRHGRYAVCGCCGEVYGITQRDTLEYMTGLLPLARWISRLAGFEEEPEKLEDGVYFLGNHEGFEVHLMRGASWENTASLQQSIVQQMTSPAIVLCLCEKPKPPVHKEMRMQSFVSCLRNDEGMIRWEWPQGALMQKDSIKQYAGKMRVVNDPCQLCKESLKTFVGKNIHSLFSGLMHPEIRSKIEKSYPDELAYQDKHGKRQCLSSQMTLAAIREVLKEKGLTDQISGLKQPY